MAEGKDSEAVISSRRLLAAGAVIVAGWLMFAGLYAVQGYLIAATINAGVGGGSALVVWWGCGKDTLHRVAFGSRLILVMSVLGLAGLGLLTGQTRAMSTWFLALVPLAATYLLGLREALRWAVVAAVAVLCIALSELWVAIVPEFVAVGAELVLGQLGLVGLVAWMCVAVQRAIDRDFAAAARAIEKLRQAQVTGLESSQILRNILDQMPAATVVANPQHEVVIVNDRFCDMFGVSEPALVGIKLDKLVRNFLHRELSAPEVLEEGLESILNSPKQTIEFEMADGRTLELESVRLGQGTVERGFLWEVKDVSFRAHKEKALVAAVSSDELTGLANRRFLELKLNELCAEEGEFGLLFVDLDGFKAINDAHGHGAGDEFLRAVGQRLSKTTRSTDVAARLGGDEFAVLMPGVSPQNRPMTTIDRLLASLNQPISHQGVSMAASASIGMAFYPSDAGSAKELLARADTLMYQAKRAGKNQVAFAQAQL